MGTTNTMDLLRDKFFFRAVFAEFFATTFFIYILTSVLVKILPGITMVQIAFCIGLAIAVLVQIFGPVSGAHINPAVTVGILVTGQLNVLRAICYIIAQLGGAIVGAALTYGLTPSEHRDKLGVLRLGRDVSEVQGFFVEMLMTMVLVFTVLASTDPNRGHHGFPPALAIGISITVSHLAAIPFTGSGINPARAFGPSVVTADFPSSHWLYWIGPLVGGALAGLLYKWVFGVPEEKSANISGEKYAKDDPRRAEMGM